MFYARASRPGEIKKKKVQKTKKQKYWDLCSSYRLKAYCNRIFALSKS